MKAAKNDPNITWTKTPFVIKCNHYVLAPFCSSFLMFLLSRFSGSVPAAAFQRTQPGVGSVFHQLWKQRRRLADRVLNGFEVSSNMLNISIFNKFLHQSIIFQSHHHMFFCFLIRDKIGRFCKGCVARLDQDWSWNPSGTPPCWFSCSSFYFYFFKKRLLTKYLYFMIFMMFRTACSKDIVFFTCFLLCARGLLTLEEKNSFNWGVELLKSSWTWPLRNCLAQSLVQQRISWEISFQRWYVWSLERFVFRFFAKLVSEVCCDGTALSVFKIRTNRWNIPLYL